MADSLFRILPTAGYRGPNLWKEKTFPCTNELKPRSKHRWLLQSCIGPTLLGWHRGGPNIFMNQSNAPVQRSWTFTSSGFEYRAIIQVSWDKVSFDGLNRARHNYWTYFWLPMRYSGVHVHQKWWPYLLAGRFTVVNDRRKLDAWRWFPKHTVGWRLLLGVVS